MIKLLKIILSIPKTIYYNFHFFKFKVAIKLPMVVGYNCRMRGKKGQIKLPPKVNRFMIKIGYSNGSYNISQSKKTYFVINYDSHVEFKGKAIISKGCYVCLNNKSNIIFGNNFSCNANCIISSQKSITFGDECLIGWDCTFIDGDGHKSFGSSKRDDTIVVGNHVWIAAKSTLLKGCNIGDGSIIGYGTIVSGRFPEKNILIASSKSEKKRENVSWEK